jgi:peptidylprolyl isomerase
MPLPDGAFVLVEYTLKVKETGEIVDTTSEEEAKKAGIYDSKERYGPKLVIVGEGRLIPGLEKLIKELSEGEEKEAEIPPSEAFGERKPENVKILPKNVFVRSGIAPQPGKVVEINGRLAVIRSVTGGRVVVDFNHPLAGKRIVARVKLVKVLDKVEDKLRYLILRRLPSFIGDNDVKVFYDPEGKIARIEFNEKALLVPDMQTAKRIVAGEAKKYLSNELRQIEFLEKVRLEEEKQEKEGAEARQGSEAGKEEQKEQTSSRS